MIVALAIQDLTGESGTYIYMAPEVIRHEQYGPSVDVYSWGILLWELVHNETPYGSMHLTAVQVRVLFHLLTLAQYRRRSAFVIRVE